MKRLFNAVLLMICTLIIISYTANADPFENEHSNMRNSRIMEEHGFSSMGYGHGMEFQDHGQKDWMMIPHNGAIHFLQMKEILGLNERQIAELKALRDSYRDENTVPEAKLKAAEESLKEIMEEDTINLDKAEGKIKEIGSLESSLWSSYVKQLAKIKSLITKDQLKKMWEMKGGGESVHSGMKE